MCDGPLHASAGLALLREKAHLLGSVSMVHSSSGLGVSAGHAWHLRAVHVVFYCVCLVVLPVLHPPRPRQTMYPYCPAWALKWSFRRQLIMQEIDKYRPDVVCLQEVQVCPL